MSGDLESVARLRPFDLGRAAANPLSNGLVQWCVVVPDLDTACARLEATYGIPGFWILEPAPLRNVTLRGNPIDLRVDMALGYLGDMNVEVLAPRSDGDGDLYREFLAERPEGGFHHLGFRVHDFDAAFAALEAEHGPVEQQGEFGTEGTRFAYFDTRSTTGLYTEILFFDESSQKNMDALRRGDERPLSRS